jgi:hypothetical protein
MGDAMIAESLPLILLTAILLPVMARGDTNLLDQIKTRKLPQTALREYVLSLDESGVVKLANEAFEKGWDPYAVGAGILGPYYESKGIVFTAEKKLAILKNPQMHPEFREYTAAWGLKDRSLDLATFLRYADEVLLFLEDEAIEYFQKQGIPDFLREALQRRAGDVRKEPGAEGDKALALEKLHACGIRVMSDLTTYLEKNPRPSKERADYSASSFAAASLSKYVKWYLSEDGSPNEATQKRLDAVRKAQREFVAILNEPTYDPTAACVVLRSAEESRLDEALSAEAVAKIKKDNRFSGEEDQRLLDALHQRIAVKGKP